VPLQLGDQHSRRWLEDLLYFMMKGSIDYVYVYHNVETIATLQPFAFSGSGPAALPIPAAILMDKETARLTLAVYYPIVSRLSYRGQIAVLKHEGIHICDGHFSSYGLRLNEHYGRELTNLAMDVYANQKPFEVKNGQPTETIGAVLEEAGMCPATIEKFKLPAGLSSEDYAELLNDTAAAQPLFIVGQDGELGTPDPADPQAGQPGKPGEDFTGKGQYRPIEVFELSKEEATQADQATRDIVHNVTEALAAHNEAELEENGWGRGFGGSDAEEFITAAKRPATVPWFYYLRAAETRNRAEIVTPTRRRLSRRSPFHFGRVRRYGLEVAFMVDTSGSMDKEQLQLVDPELRGLHCRGAHITVIHCDASVAKVAPYSPFESLERFHGRGGTEFSDALFKVRELYPRPGLFVGFTDGYGGIESYAQTIRKERGAAWYDEFVSRKPGISPDGIETLWLIPEGSMDPKEFTRTIVPWGTVIVVPTVEREIKAS